MAPNVCSFHTLATGICRFIVGFWKNTCTPTSPSPRFTDHYFFTPNWIKFHTSLTTYSTEQRLSWAADRFTASKRIPNNLCNPKVSLPHKLPATCPIMSQINPVHAPHFTSWRSALILSSHLRLGLPSSLIKFNTAFKLNYVPKTTKRREFWHSNLISDEWQRP